MKLNMPLNINKNSYVVLEYETGFVNINRTDVSNPETPMVISHLTEMFREAVYYRKAIVLQI